MIGSACRRSLLLADMWACERHPYHVRIASRPRPRVVPGSVHARGRSDLCSIAAVKLTAWVAA